MWGASNLFRNFASNSVAASAVLLSVSAGMAADMPIKAPPVVPPTAAPQWFVEGNLGAGWGYFNDLKFLNPVAVATGAPLSPTSGNYIVLGGKSLNRTSVDGGVSAGYFFTNQLFAKATYQYFGKFSASGFAQFPDPLGYVRQDLSTTAQGLLVGLGGDFNMTPVIFVEPTAQIGVGFLHSTGFQGANVGLNNPFPSQNHTNFIAGAGLGVGYHVSSALDVLVSGNYYYLGKADTGVTGNPPPGTMNTGEQLQSKLSEATLNVTGRVKF